uniref:Uncharacterized protein n=1 Tax=Anguilla anguilla TaxID=7936 RepID=A0A0E9VAU1_ANGAN
MHCHRGAKDKPSYCRRGYMAATSAVYIQRGGIFYLLIICV